MDLRGTSVTVVGLARSGVSAALLLKERGADVRATDAKEARDLGTTAATLEKAGVRLFLGGHPTDALEGAKLVGANLMLAIMHRAILRGVDASRSNLFCADLTGAIGDEKTTFAGSNVKRALVAGVAHG